MLVKLGLIGSYGAISGATIARMTKNSTTTAPPSTALRLRRNLERMRLRFFGRAMSSVMAIVIGMPQARIDENIKDIGQKVHDDETDRRAKDDALNDRVVAVEHGIDDELAEAGNGEDLLGQHRAREKLAEQQRRERDDRDQRVAQRVLEHDGARHKALGARGPDIVGTQDAEHGAAGMAHEARREARAEHECRHDHRLDVEPEILARRHEAGGGQKLPAHRDQHDEQDAEPEIRESKGRKARRRSRHSRRSCPS